MPVDGFHAFSVVVGGRGCTSNVTFICTEMDEVRNFLGTSILKKGNERVKNSLAKRQHSLLPVCAAESPCALSMGMKAAFLVWSSGVGLPLASSHLYSCVR